MRGSRRKRAGRFWAECRPPFQQVRRINGPVPAPRCADQELTCTECTRALRLPVHPALLPLLRKVLLLTGETMGYGESKDLPTAKRAHSNSHAQSMCGLRFAVDRFALAV